MATRPRLRLRRRADGLQLPLRQIRRDLPEVPQARLALGEIPLDPAQRRLLILRRTALGVEMHELECVLEQKVRELAGLNRGIGM